MVDTQLGKKKLETELSFRDGTETQDLLDQEPCSSATSLLFSVLQAESICFAAIKSDSCVLGHVSHFIDHFELLAIFFVQGVSPAGGHTPDMPWGKHLCV